MSERFAALAAVPHVLHALPAGEVAVLALLQVHAVLGNLEADPALA